MSEELIEVNSSNFNLDNFLITPTNLNKEEFQKLRFSAFSEKLKEEIKPYIYDGEGAQIPKTINKLQVNLQYDCLLILITYFYASVYPEHFGIYLDTGYAFAANFLRWVDRIGFKSLLQIIATYSKSSAHEKLDFLKDYIEPDNLHTDS